MGFSGSYHRGLWDGQSSWHLKYCSCWRFAWCACAWTHVCPKYLSVSCFSLLFKPRIRLYVGCCYFFLFFSHLTGLRTPTVDYISRWRVCFCSFISFRRELLWNVRLLPRRKRLNPVKPKLLKVSCSCLLSWWRLSLGTSEWYFYISVCPFPMSYAKRWSISSSWMFVFPCKHWN